MKEKFTLIHTGGPYGDESSTYDGVLNCPLTVRDFIEAVLNEHDDEWGNIGIGGIFYRDGEYIEYSHGKIEQSIEPLSKYLDKNVKSFIAHGGWTNMNYVLTIED